MFKEWTKQDLLGSYQIVNPPVGRSRQRWQDDVMEDLKTLKDKNWKEIAKDRRTWRDFSEKAKTHKGLQCQMMKMMTMMMMMISNVLTGFTDTSFRITAQMDYRNKK